MRRSPVKAFNWMVWDLRDYSQSFPKGSNGDRHSACSAKPAKRYVHKAERRQVSSDLRNRNWAHL